MPRLASFVDIRRLNQRVAVTGEGGVEVVHGDEQDVFFLPAFSWAWASPMKRPTASSANASV